MCRAGRMVASRDPVSGSEPARGGGAGGERGERRIIAANQLRGVASLSVVLAHLGGVFVLLGPFVAWMTSMPEVRAGHPAILLLTSWRYLNFGAFGVSIFFLISGFVIPFSLRGQPAAGFLVARAFRIFPTFWAALLVEWALVHLQSRVSGRGVPFGTMVYLQNALLLDTVIGGGFVDLVNWTLSIEIKFYVLMALLRPAVLKGRVLPFFVVALAAIVVAVAQRHGLLPISTLLADEPMYVAFMLIGTIFHYQMTGLMRPLPAQFCMLGLGALVALCWTLGPISGQMPVIAINYGYGLAVFAAAYAARGLFRPNRVLDGLAAVSYPLYLVHSIVGYSMMALAMHVFRLPYTAALGFGLAAVLLVATVLHLVVEAPTLRLGRRLARRWVQPPRA